MIGYSVTRKPIETLVAFIRPQCETVSRLRLLCFSFNIYSDVLSTLVLFTLSNLFQAHHKDFSKDCVLQNNLSKHNLRILYRNKNLASAVRAVNLYGGPGGIRTRFQNLFLFASYSNNSIIMPFV